MVIKASVTGLQEPQKLASFRWKSITGEIELADGLSKPTANDSLEQGILMMILLAQPRRREK